MAQKAQALVAEFAQHKTWEDKYKNIIQRGKALPEMAESDKVDEALVKGCQSRVWLHVKLDEQGRMQLRGDSDAILVRGLVATILHVYNGSTPAEILQFKPTFVGEMGFRENLSPSRANGLVAMIRQIHLFAQAFATVDSSKT